MTNDVEQMRYLADRMFAYLKPKIKNMMSSNIRYFRAEVVSNPGDGTLVVQRAMDPSTMTLPCMSSMAGAEAGQQVIVFVLGDLSNAIVVSNGSMTDFVGDLASVVTDIRSQYTALEARVAALEARM